VAQALKRRGVRAYALAGGFDAWKDAGYPLEPK
jgi:rhodanese-related sulfurtransferase